MFAFEDGLTHYTAEFQHALRHTTDINAITIRGRREVSKVRDSYNNNLLHVAAKYCGKRLLESLIYFGCSVNERNRFGNTPLFYAVKTGNVVAVETLLDYEAEVDIKNKDGETPLHFCTKFYDKRVFQLLVKALLEKVSELEVGQMLLDADCHLYKAVWMRSPQVIKFMLEKRGNINAPDAEGYTVIHAAIYEGSVEMIEYLLELGANVNVETRLNFGILHWAAQQDYENNYEEVLEFLLRNGVKVNHGYSSEGRSALHLVSKFGEAKIIRLMLDCGADVTVTDNYGKNALHFAAKNGDDEVVKILLETGKLEVNSKNKSGRTALHIATKWMNGLCIKHLLERGADVNSQDKDGRTPLYLVMQFCGPLCSWRAHKMNDEQVTELLLEYGADLSKRTVRNETILGEVVKKDKTHMIRLLLRYIAKLEASGCPVAKLLQPIANSRLYNKYYRSCSRELAKMKMSKIYGTVTHFSVLVNRLDAVVSYTRNDELCKRFEDSDYIVKFPIYYTTLSSKFDNAVEKQELLQSAEKVLGNSLFFNDAAIIHKVLGYLDIDDLRNLQSMCSG